MRSIQAKKLSQVRCMLDLSSSQHRRLKKEFNSVPRPQRAAWLRQLQITALAMARPGQ